MNAHRYLGVLATVAAVLSLLGPASAMAASTVAPGIATIAVNNGATIPLASGGSQAGIPIAFKNIPSQGPDNGLAGFAFNLNWNKDVFHIDAAAAAPVPGWIIEVGIPDNNTGILQVAGMTGAAFLTADTVIANLTVRATGAAGSSTDLTPVIVSFGDKNGAAIPVAPLSAVVQISVTTTPPSVTTAAASSVTYDGGTLNGNLTSMGTATTVNVFFEYGSTASYGLTTPPGSVTAPGVFDAPITGLTPATVYHFRARADAGAHGSANGAGLEFKSAYGPPPSDLTATVTSSTRIDLNWIDNTSDETGFRVERRMGLTGTWTLVGTVLPNVTTMSSLGLTPGATYYYRVRAVRVAELSAWSGVASATPPVPPPPAILVTSPTGADTWAAGESRNITWTSVSVAPTALVRIDVSYDAGATWRYITITANDGAHTWMVSAPATTTQAIIRVSSFTPVASSQSPQFTINGPAITVVSPNGGEGWTAGETRHITWTSRGVSAVSYVRIEISRNSGTTWETAVPMTLNDGDHTWTVTGPATANARIKITSTTAGRPSDTSEADFAIAGPPPSSITVTSPSGGEVWPAGISRTITWSTVSIAPTAMVIVQVTRNNGATWTTIGARTAGAGSMSWMVTVPGTNQASIRVMTAGLAPVSDVSATFAILTYPLLVSPAMGATTTDNTPTLTWAASPGAASYTVHVSRSPAFTTTVASVSGITGTDYTTDPLTVSGALTVYYWRVSAQGTDGATTRWSPLRYFILRQP